MDYRQYFENFVEDFRKEFDQKQLYEQKIDKLNAQHEELIKKLEGLINRLNQNENKTNSFFLDNSQFIKLMGISQKTAQTWRDTGVVSFSQIGNKIYYRISDIQQLLQDNFIKAKRKEADND